MIEIACYGILSFIHLHDCATARREHRASEALHYALAALCYMIMAGAKCGL